MTVSLGPTRITLLSAVATAATTGTSIPVAVHGRDSLAFYFKSNGTTTGGTLVIEEADYDPAVDPTYAGTWSQIGATINANDFTGTKQLAVHISPNAYSTVRVRIATDVTGGGTVTVVLKMQ
jgi:hypothetical protein